MGSPVAGPLRFWLSVPGSSVIAKMTDQLAVVFPDCHQCGRFGDGPAGLCVSCARPRLELVGPDTCGVCSQQSGAGGRCPNELCRSPRRRISRIHAIAYQSGPLRRAINGYKYRGARDWSVIFGRLLLGWLAENMTADPPDLIVTNPSFAGPGGQQFAHTEAVLEAAAAEAAAAEAVAAEAVAAEAVAGEAVAAEAVIAGGYAGGRWHFDTATPRAIVKTAQTLKSADAEAWSKRAAATDLRDALAVPDRARTEGRFILVYDDICTTGGQLDAVAGCLLDQGGAARVEGVVLARAPWRGLSS
jgi:predicted amidophosphoribosyltransferase